LIRRRRRPLRSSRGGKNPRESLGLRFSHRPHLEPLSFLSELIEGTLSSLLVFYSFVDLFLGVFVLALIGCLVGVCFILFCFLFLGGYGAQQIE